MPLKKPKTSSFAPTDSENGVSVAASSSAPRSPEKSENGRPDLVSSSNSFNLLFQQKSILYSLWGPQRRRKRFFFNLYQPPASWGLVL
uniref:Uncharacterized protein n=1 Tax=Picea sitchensis TaxID=3332 RepID=A9P181_PICSI|nr:unknown [Picea sitchensis]